jgi:hypothetical protein
MKQLNQKFKVGLETAFISYSPQDGFYVKATTTSNTGVFEQFGLKRYHLLEIVDTEDLGGNFPYFKNLEEINEVIDYLQSLTTTYTMNEYHKVGDCEVMIGYGNGRYFLTIRGFGKPSSDIYKQFIIRTKDPLVHPLWDGIDDWKIPTFNYASEVYTHMHELKLLDAMQKNRTRRGIEITQRKGKTPQ